MKKISSSHSSQSSTFAYRTRVAFHETDMMGVVHHSNHVRYFEEARVAWMRETGLTEIHIPKGDLTFAVYETSTRYFKTLAFEDEIEIKVEAKLEGVRIYFQYAIFKVSDGVAFGDRVATGTTVLVALDRRHRPARLPASAREVFAKQVWTAQGL